MKRILPSKNVHQWPRAEVKSLECRKRDFIVRIADWTRDREEPAYDVEVYIGGVYDWNESKTFSLRDYPSKAACKAAAAAYANSQTTKLV